MLVRYSLPSLKKVSHLCYYSSQKEVCSIMSTKELYEKLVSDLKLLRMPIEEVDLFLRPYSSSYYGRYFPVHDEKRTTPRVFIYPFKENGDLYDYQDILDTTIHEMVHHIQHSTPSFVRVKGVMHDPNFWKLYDRYINKAKQLNMIKENKLHGSA